MVESLDTLTTYRCPHCGFRSKGTDPKDAEFRREQSTNRSQRPECPHCETPIMPPQRSSRHM